jgi:hypothetical protein
MKLTIDKEAWQQKLVLNRSLPRRTEIGRHRDQLIPKSAAADEIGRRSDQMLYLSKRVPSSQLGKVEVEPAANMARLCARRGNAWDAPDLSWPRKETR